VRLLAAAAAAGGVAVHPAMRQLLLRLLRLVLICLLQFDKVTGSHKP
jgi:hypothetical protein